MKRFTIEHDNVKVHVDTLWEASIYARNLESGKIIEHTVVYDFSKKSVKIDKHNIHSSE